MPRVRVLGSDYKDAFDSARAIIGAGMLSEEMPGCYVDSDGCICNGVNEFEFIESDGADERARESDFRLEEDGASWFAAIRRRAAGNLDDAEISNAHLWEEFLTDLSRKYHDKYFLVACKRRSNKGESAEQDTINEQYRGFMENIMQTFFPAIRDWEFTIPQGGSAGFDNIYGLSLRMQIGTGGEKEIPVLGTLYFKQHGTRMIPLAAEDAEKIENSLESLDDSGSKEQQQNTNVAETNNTLNLLFSELTRIISEDKIGDHLVECFRFDDADTGSIGGLLSRIQNDNKVLVCKQVEILGISHVNWERYSYTIDDKRNGNPLFNIVGGIDGKVVMSCMGCKDKSDLILSNRVSIQDPETGERTTFIIDPSVPGLGLDEEDMERITHSGHFTDHYMSIGSYCGTPRGGKTCSRTLCKSHLIEVETSAGNKMHFCRDCSYPEVLYTDEEGHVHYTPNLRFDTQAMKLVLPEKLAGKPCSLCGRYVTSLRSDMFCSLCATAFGPNAADKKTGIINYRKYKGLLPVQKRMGAARKTKLCFEDNELLIFVLDDKKLLFHKFWLDESGFSKSPDDKPLT